MINLGIRRLLTATGARRGNRLLLMLCLVSAAMGCGTGGQVGSSNQNKGSNSIINGTPTTDWPAVGALAYQEWIGSDQYFSYCTGTLIAPDWVLTAAHCLEDYAVEDMYFFIRDPARETEPLGVFLPIDGKFPHPNYFYRLGGIADIGLVHLKPLEGEDPRFKALQEINPVPIQLSTISSSLAGMAKDEREDPLVLYVVGFGQNEKGIWGIKRVGKALLGKIGLFLIEIKPRPDFAGQTICYGDSGGPSLLYTGGINPVLVGVNARSTCSSDESAFAVPLDLYLNWIHALIQTGETPSPECTGLSAQCGEQACSPLIGCVPTQGILIGQECYDNLYYETSVSCVDTACCAQVDNNLGKPAGSLCLLLCRSEDNCPDPGTTCHFDNRDPVAPGEAFGYCAPCGLEGAPCCGRGEPCGGGLQCSVSWHPRCEIPGCSCENRECGDDGCGRSCGECYQPNMECQDKGFGATWCYCSASHAWCYGVCCEIGESCDKRTERCCRPNCPPNSCGDDGCGGSCGPCPSGTYCASSQNTCVCIPPNITCGVKCCSPYQRCIDGNCA